MTPATGSDDLFSQLHLDQIDVLNLQGIANLINNALLEPMQEYQPLDSLPPHDEKFVALCFLRLMFILLYKNSILERHQVLMVCQTGF